MSRLPRQTEVMDVPHIEDMTGLRDKALGGVFCMADAKKSVKFQMMMSPAEAAALDEWGFEHKIKSRAEAIRQLCAKGLLYDLLDRNYECAANIALSFIKGERPSAKELEEFISLREAHIAELKKDFEVHMRAVIHDLAEKIASGNIGMSYEKSTEIAINAMLEATATERGKRVLSQMKAELEVTDGDGGSVS